MKPSKENLLNGKNMKYLSSARKNLKLGCKNALYYYSLFYYIEIIILIRTIVEKFKSFKIFAKYLLDYYSMYII